MRVTGEDKIPDPQAEDTGEVFNLFGVVGRDEIIE